MNSTNLIGAGLGALLAASVLLWVAVWNGWRLNLSPGASPRPSRSSATSGPWLLVALLAGVAVAVLTRWPVAAVSVAAAVALWPHLFGAAGAAAGQLQRLEGLATWTEALRDSIAGAVGLEEAIKHTTPSAPQTLAGPLRVLSGRLRAQIPLPEALLGFADDLDDPSADLVVAALLLNARLRGPGLVRTLTRLADSTREELAMRRQVEEKRKRLRRDATIIMAVAGFFAVGLSVWARDFLAPYASLGGQVVLLVVMGLFAGALLWMRSAANPEPLDRFLATDVAAAPFQAVAR